MFPLAAEITGAPALIIILIVLALIVTGVVVALRATGRGIKKGVDHLGSDGQKKGRT